MAKIYSRPRIKIPKVILQTNKRMQSKKGKKLVTIIIILIIAFGTVKVILDAVLPIFDELCEHEAKSIATMVSNQEATNVMREHTYDELFSIQKDTNGNITMLKANVIPINEIISDVAIKIQDSINKKGRDNIEIALRKFYRIQTFGRKRSWC